METEEETIRWKATIWYRSEAGPVEKTMELHEIFDIHEEVEQGPHWDTIAKVEIWRSGPYHMPITLEQAEKIKSMTLPELLEFHAGQE